MNLLKDIHKDKSNRISKRIAMTQNITEIPAETSRELMQGYNVYINEGYSSPITKDINIGIKGLYGYQLLEPGINEPYIFLREIYHLNKKGNNIVYLNEYQYKLDGTIKKKTSRKFEDKKWKDIENMITVSCPSLNDPTITVVPLLDVTSYNDAKFSVEQRVKEQRLKEQM